MPSRPMNKNKSTDHDFVPPTKYSLNRTNKPLPNKFSQLELLPAFKAMDLQDTTGASSQIPDTIDSRRPEALFSLFFTDSVLVIPS
jgi:hypothetical protein